MCGCWGVEVSVVFDLKIVQQWSTSLVNCENEQENYQMPQWTYVDGGVKNVSNFVTDLISYLDTEEYGTPQGFKRHGGGGRRGLCVVGGGQGHHLENDRVTLNLGAWGSVNNHFMTHYFSMFTRQLLGASHEQGHYILHEGWFFVKLHVHSWMDIDKKEGIKEFQQKTMPSLQWTPLWDWCIFHFRKPPMAEMPWKITMPNNMVLEVLCMQYRLWSGNPCWGQVTFEHPIVALILALISSSNSWSNRVKMHSPWFDVVI